jgi:hypothetical protein
VYPPTITGFSPTHALAGTSVTITGTHFTDKSEVRFYAANSAGWVRVDTFAVVDAHTITALIPLTAATGSVKVVTNDGTGTSATDFVVDLPLPTVTSIPASAGIGETITIAGTHFNIATSVTVNGTLASFQVVSETSMKVTVPIGATTGRIQVTASPYGTGTSLTNIEITSGAAAGGPKKVVLPIQYKRGRSITIAGRTPDYQLLYVKSKGACTVATSYTKIAGVKSVKSVKVKMKASAGYCVLTIRQTNLKVTGTSRYQWTIQTY